MRLVDYHSLRQGLNDDFVFIFSAMIYWNFYNSILSLNYLVCLNFCFITQEHLFIVCELLKANLYEFQKFSRESGGEAYFTLRRLQVCSTMLSLSLPNVLVS